MRPIYECYENNVCKPKISRWLRKNIHILRKNIHIIYNLITIVNIATLFTSPINKYVKAKLELDNSNHNPNPNLGSMAFGLQRAKVLG